MTFTVAELEVAINSDGNFWLSRNSDERQDELYPYTLFDYFDDYGRAEIRGIGIAKVIVIDQSHDEGYRFDTWLVFEIDGRFFRKTGVYMSFDGYSWDGPLEEVKLTPVTREEWVAV